MSVQLDELADCITKHFRIALDAGQLSIGRQLYFDLAWLERHPPATPNLDIQKACQKDFDALMDFLFYIETPEHDGGLGLHIETEDGADNPRSREMVSKYLDMSLAGIRQEREALREYQVKINKILTQVSKFIDNIRGLNVHPRRKA